MSTLMMVEDAAEILGVCDHEIQVLVEMQLLRVAERGFSYDWPCIDPDSLFALNQIRQNNLSRAAWMARRGVA